jgi:hypothetical protein
MKKFLVLFMAPAASLAAWMQIPEETRGAEEAKMKGEWDVWMQAHGGMIKETAGAGKNIRVTKDGVSAVANDVMLYALVEGESHEAVAGMFTGHPHFGIPGAWIEVMPANVLMGI